MVSRLLASLQYYGANYIIRKISNKVGVKKIDLFNFGEDVDADADLDGEEDELDDEYVDDEN